MAEVRPFRALRYNPEILRDSAEVLCPPFDTITPELQASLYERSPYNVVRLEAGEQHETDTPQNNRYTRAAVLLRGWRKERVLLRDPSPAFYLVRHTFRFRGEQRARLELMARVRLQEYEKRVVLPHEHTRDDDKRDRLALMKACSANFSPIMCLYREGTKSLAPILERVIARTAFMEVEASGGEGYTLWSINDQESANEIGLAMNTKVLYVADGHHRYETALAYRDLVKVSGGGAHLEAGSFGLVMMGLIEFDDPGLIVLPYHRALRFLDSSTLARVRGGLMEWFSLDQTQGGKTIGLEAFLEEIDRRGQSQMVIGLLEPGSLGFQMLVLKERTDLSSWGPIGRSEAWVLEDRVLRPIMEDSLAERLEYVHEAEEVERGVRTGQYQMGFFLKSFPLDLFETIINQGQMLPPKSTFFYPKLPTGLIINLLEEGP